MIPPLSRPEYSRIYEAIITHDQNPIVLWFPYYQEAFQYQKGFYIGLEQHNEYIYSDIRYREANPSTYKYTLTFWR